MMLDGLGAMLSAFLLGIVLIRFQPSVGMPTESLYWLALVPCIFIIYDLLCFGLVKSHWNLYLNFIASANLSYCFISILLVFQHFHKLTTLGLTYFILEIIIVILLVVLEIKIARKWKAEFDT